MQRLLPTAFAQKIPRGMNEGRERTQGNEGWLSFSSFRERLFAPASLTDIPCPLKPRVLAAMTPEAFASIPAVRLANLRPRQVRALTPEERQALSPEQRCALRG